MSFYRSVIDPSEPAPSPAREYQYLISGLAFEYATASLDNACQRMFTLYPDLFLRIGSSIELVAGHGKDVFVHISAVQRAGMDDLREGAKVTFDIVDNRGKPVADNLRGEMRIEVRTLIATLLVILMATTSAFARKASQHHSKRSALNHHSTTKTDPGGVARDPADVALDRKIGSICRGC